MAINVQKRETELLGRFDEKTRKKIKLVLKSYGRMYFLQDQGSREDAERAERNYLANLRKLTDVLEPAADLLAHANMRS